MAQIPDQVSRSQKNVADTYTSMDKKKYTIRNNKNLLTATGLIRDARVRTGDLKSYKEIAHHKNAQQLLFDVITLYAWACLQYAYGKSLNINWAETAINRAVIEVYNWVIDGNRTPSYRMFTRTSTVVRSRYLDAIPANNDQTISISDPDGKEKDIPQGDNAIMDWDLLEYIENLVLELRDRNELSESQKEMLCYKLGLMDHELLDRQGDIARKMNISDAAVSQGLNKALKILMQHYESENGN